MFYHLNFNYHYKFKNDTNIAVYIIIALIYQQCFIIIIVIGHTQSKAPDPIRTPKLSDWRHG